MPDDIQTPEQIAAAEAGHPTENPDGITSSNYDYWPRTQEEKATALGMTFAESVEVDIEEPYPEGEPMDEEAQFEVLSRIRSPNELVPGDDRLSASERNLAAGGSMELDEVRKLRTRL